jgi:septal ring factor EnvC (AmiA/AmiB activator)
MERPQMGAPDPLNTVNTPTHDAEPKPETEIAKRTTDVAERTISSMQSQIDDLRSDLKTSQFELGVTRKNLSDIQAKEAERRMRRAVNRAAKRMDSTSPSDVLDMMKRKDTGPGLFDAV